MSSPVVPSRKAIPQMKMEDESETKCALILPPCSTVALSKVMSTCLQQSFVGPMFPDGTFRLLN